MVFFAGIIVGAVIGAVCYRYFYTLECSRSEVICNSAEKDREMHKQLERLIRYGNDM